MTERLTLQDVKRAANDRPGEVLGRLGVDMSRARGSSGTILMSDPMTKDSNPSLAIWTRKPGGISWHRYGSDAKGDIIDLVSYLNGWYWLASKGRPEALRWLTDALGLARISPEQRKKDHDRARRRQAEEAKQSAEAEEEARARAFGWWTQAKPLRGSLAEIYLRARGIDIDALPRGPRGGDLTPNVIRFVESAKHIWIEPGTPRDRQESWWPCMLTGCVDFSAPTGTGRVRAVHRTWLAKDGSDKAPVKPARKAWPGTSGLVMPLWRGESGLSVKDAIANGLRETLVLTEGVEDGLSAALAAPQYRTWAVLSLDNLGNVPVPESVDAIIVHRQNDWQKLAAIAAFDRAMAKLRAHGRPIAEVAAYGGKDLNDTLRGAA